MSSDKVDRAAFLRVAKRLKDSSKNMTMSQAKKQTAELLTKAENKRRR